ncbi:hypothetical protein CFC21_009846 [Triticum aestivum]|uniref:Bowman-Birk serine protease inhibitors family domain-containing protein n=3 Tax=Triticinae TaxID=1648030 RepID=A0A452XKW0_AEGTS|nr:Bowman-Birk type trypsin inhibitor [Aegilops tauschii subsp. strangulata]XP_044436315.1 Bowman-Birk type trypsin inhibitor-like [Triticum aestivum]KAF6992892.1 hypothetical protein CFC21_009846 [Triticum aestivum]
MRPLVLLVALAIVAVLAALPGLGTAQLRAKGATPSAWPCCNNCGSCTRSLPPQCVCRDVSPRGCDPACNNCVRSNSTVAGRRGFQCFDRIKNFCERRCTPVV